MYHIHFNFIFFLHTGHGNYDLIDIQYLENVAFSFKKVQIVKVTPLQISTAR